MLDADTCGGGKERHRTTRFGAMSKDFNAGNPPLIAVAPEGVRDYLAGAVTNGGGRLADLPDADALIWADPRDREGLMQAMKTNPRLRWVQLPFAGVDPLIDALDDDRVWTSAKGAYGDEVAEHALALALAGLRQIAHFARQDRWSKQRGRSLFGARVTILGAGGLTDSLVRLLEPFDCNISVLRRQHVEYPGVDFTGTLADLGDVLPRTDVLFLNLALTDQTRGVIDAQRLEELPEHAWIVNVARGPHIVTEDLLDALRNGTIAGAALDVTDPEPLPSGHPLWSMDNCIITPHSANTPAMSVPTFTARVTENVRRFATGEELLGIVDLNLGY